MSPGEEREDVQLQMDLRSAKGREGSSFLAVLIFHMKKRKLPLRVEEAEVG